MKTAQSISSEGTQTPLVPPPNLRIGSMKSQIGESRSGGGFDTDFKVEKYRGWWIGSFRSPFIAEVGDRHFISIMPAHDPYELALDAFLDFIDRLRDGRIPRDVEEPLELMDMCCWAARRQR